ncbi:hypothetical protein [Paracidovorax wautersii]|uniref:hypothetical protein n=1 Tax=Paracidovorax wautersii TaxID=1177982 RepID=UPI0031DDC7D3
MMSPILRLDEARRDKCAGNAAINADAAFCARGNRIAHMETSNGVLAQVLGDELSAALNLLPPAGEGMPELMTAEADSVHHGRVVVTFRLVLHKRGRTRHWFWTPAHAEPLATGPWEA